MSNSIAPGSSADVNVRVNALTTNPNVPVTYKTIILKKNLVNGVNTLTQAMMNQENIKYVIKYDYILGEDITIPANCVLEFDGGSISNGTIVGNNTKIISFEKKIFNSVSLSGSWINKIFFVEYFLDDFSLDCSDVLNDIIQSIPLDCELRCNSNLLVSKNININKNIDIHFNSNITLNNNGSFVLNGISYRNLYFRKITGDGHNGETRGLKLINASFNNIEFNLIEQCKYALSFNENNGESQSIGQNIFRYLLIYACEIGIYFKGNESPVIWSGEGVNVVWAEGNEFIGGFIAKCYTSGIYLDNNIKCGNTIFIGAVDCVEAGDSAYDIIDNTNTTDYAQKNVYISNFLRASKVQLRNRDTIVSTEYGLQSYSRISSHDGVTIENGDNKSNINAGSIEIANTGGGFIDLKNDKIEDRDIRIQSDGNNLSITSASVNGAVKVSVGDHASIESEAAAGKVSIKNNSLRGTDGGMSLTPTTGNRGIGIANNVLNVQNAGNISVAEGSTTKTVGYTFKPSTNDYVLFITPSWKTLYNITSRSVDGFVVSFDTAAPSDASIDWIMMGKGAS